jgi:DNA-binding NarL/FixJ family response regulator
MTVASSTPPVAAVTKARVFVVDDHPIVRIGLKRVIESEADLECCGEATSAAEALDRLRSVQADLVLVDVSLPGANGIELIKNIRAEHEKLPIMVLSVHDEGQYAMRSLRAGANGYLMKKEAADQLAPALRRVLRGEIAVSKNFGEELIYKAARSGANGASPVDALSDRELEVLSLLGEGRSTQEMARALSLSVKTIESHRLHIKEKLGLRSSVELVRFAMEWTAHQTEV